jgi:hypothetical protein
MVANGALPIGAGTPIVDVMDAAGILVATGRAVPPGKWIDSMIERAREERVSRMPHHLC